MSALRHWCADNGIEIEVNNRGIMRETRFRKDGSLLYEVLGNPMETWSPLYVLGLLGAYIGK